MSKVAIMLANGCEEIEALTVVDILRRAKITIDTIATMGDKTVISSHNIGILCDKLLEEINPDEYDAIVLPGGMPGSTNLFDNKTVCDAVIKAVSNGKLVAAICAAPFILGQLGLLNGKKATCYPGFEDKLTGATITGASSVTDGNIITGKGMGAAIDFALDITSYLTDAATAEEISKSIQYK